MPAPSRPSAASAGAGIAPAAAIELTADRLIEGPPAGLRADELRALRDGEAARERGRDLDPAPRRRRRPDPRAHRRRPPHRAPPMAVHRALSLLLRLHLLLRLLLRLLLTRARTSAGATSSSQPFCKISKTSCSALVIALLWS